MKYTAQAITVYLYEMLRTIKTFSCNLRIITNHIRNLCTGTQRIFSKDIRCVSYYLYGGCYYDAIITMRVLCVLMRKIYWYLSSTRTDGLQKSTNQ